MLFLVLVAITFAFLVIPRWRTGQAGAGSDPRFFRQFFLPENFKKMPWPTGRIKVKIAICVALWKKFFWVKWKKVKICNFLKNNYSIFKSVFYRLTINKGQLKMKKQQSKVPQLNKGQKQVCNSYIEQSYLLNKYQTLKADTKEVVNSYFDILNQNIIILNNERYIQKIERTQRRFDSKSFIDYVQKSNDKKLQLLINGFYKAIKTVELKPFDDNLEKIKRKEKTNAK